MDEYLKELGELLGAERAAREILFDWSVLFAVYKAAPADTFMWKGGRSVNERLKRLAAAAHHIDGLLPLLDDSLVHLTAGLAEGPEGIEETQERVEALRAGLLEMREGLTRAAALHRQEGPGRQLKLSPLTMLTIVLISWLKEAGLEFKTGENAKFVRAVRVCWSAAGLDTDPRDLLRSLESRAGRKSPRGRELRPLRRVK